MARGHELVVVRREHAQRTLRAGLGCATLLHVPKRAYTLRNLSVTAKETLTEEDAKIGFQLALASLYTTTVRILYGYLDCIRAATLSHGNAQIHRGKYLSLSEAADAITALNSADVKPLLPLPTTGTVATA